MNFVIYQNRERLYVLQVTRFTVIPSHEPVWFVCGDVPEVGCSQCQDRRQQVSEDASISYKFRCWLMEAERWMGELGGGRRWDSRCWEDYVIHMNHIGVRLDVGVVPITVDRVTVALRWWICCAAYASIVIHQKILSWTVRHITSVLNSNNVSYFPLFCGTVSIMNLMCRYSPFGECDAVGISSESPLCIR